MPEKISESELIQALSDVFRTHGYGGASMTLISQATGLKKSSLYHRFPDGKQQMATAVADAIAQRVEDEALAPLRASGQPKQKVKATANRLSTFYHGGATPCAIDTLSITSDQGEDTLAALRRSYDALLEGFKAVAIEAGLKPKAAQQRAVRAIVLLQGSLVVSRLNRDNTEFERVVAELPALLCEQ